MADDTTTTTTTPKVPRDYVRALGPDNRYYRFPKGTTKDQAITYFKNKGITGAASPRPKTTAPSAAPKAPAQGVQAQPPQDFAKEHPFYAGTAEGFGLDPQKLQKYGTPELARESMQNFSKLADKALRDPFELGRAIESVATGLEKGVHEIGHGMGVRQVGPLSWKFEPMDEGEMLHGLGMTMSSLGQILGGAEGVEKMRAHTTVVDGATKVAMDTAKKVGVDTTEAARGAHEASTHPTWRAVTDRKAIETAYLHNKFIDIANKINKASKAIDTQVASISDNLAKQIDSNLPKGSVDATDAAAKIKEAFKEEIKAPEKAHPILRTMVKDATTTPDGLWSWEKVRQFRSSIGRSMNKVAGPQRAVLVQTYADLTKRLGDAAKKADLEGDWKYYNELESKTSKQFRGLIDDVYANSRGMRKSGRSVAKKLVSDMGMTSELARNLGKYGLDYSEIMRATKNAKKIFKDEGGIGKSMWNYAYRGGAPLFLAMKMGGAGYFPSLAAGFALGWTVTQVMKTARALRLSGDLAEHIMKQREIPGPRRPGTGKFPKGEPPMPKGPEEPPAPTPGGVPPTAPAPAAPPTPPPEAKPSLASKYGLNERPPSAPGLVSFQDRETGGSIEMKEGFTEEQLKAKVEAHRKAMAETPPEGKSDVAAKKAEEAKKVPEVKKAAPEEYGREPGAKPGTTRETKVTRGAKQRERVAKTRAEKGVTALGGGTQEVSGGDVAMRALEVQAREAQSRAMSSNLDVSQLTIPLMEETLRAWDKDVFDSLQDARKDMKLPEVDYKAYLTQMLLEVLERREGGAKE